MACGFGGCIAVLDPLQSLLLAFGCLLAGAALNRRVPFLAQYNIPAPVTGGLLFALGVSAAGALGGVAPGVNGALKPVLLLMFFAGVGLGADLRQLARGGRTLLRFIAVLVPFVILQDALGVGLARLLDMHPLFGLVGGSITLVGGHGTGAAYAERFAEVNNLQSVMELSMTLATIGLILGGVVAGPVVQHLIERHRLRAATPAANAADDEDAGGSVSTQAMILTLAGVLFGVVAGEAAASATAGLPLTVPAFLWCMLVGVGVRNLSPYAGIVFDDRAAELIAGVCLALFLVMTMMTLDLVEAVLGSGPLLAIVVAQAALVALFASLVTWRVLGRDYEAAVSSAAFVGFAMGSTATAIANMQAITARYGPAPMAYLVVPLVGAFFLDLLNAVVLTGFLSLGWVGG
jgi:ESS family glutamate:Na+ symporter